MSQLRDTLVDFVKVLRTSDVKVSPAETLDAMETLDLVGFEDRQFLKNSLSLVLSKNPEEKDSYETCFERFFTTQKMADLNQAAMAGDDGQQAEGDFSSESSGEGQPNGKSPGGGGGSSRIFTDSVLLF